MEWPYGERKRGERREEKAEGEQEEERENRKHKVLECVEFWALRKEVIDFDLGGWLEFVWQEGVETLLAKMPLWSLR